MKLALFVSLLSLNTEHQIRLCDDRKSVLEKLHLNDVQEKKFQVYYLETPERKLSDLGVSVRLRMKNSSAEITVKKRLPGSSSQFGQNGQTICEYDLHGNAKELSCKINASIDKKEADKIFSGKKNWLEVISKEQLAFLQQYKADLKEAVIFGTLIDHRYQWNDKKFGEVTLDFVEQENKEEMRFDEVSIRYPVNDISQGKKFEEFFKSTGVNACANQLDWPVNKFDTLEILN